MAELVTVARPYAKAAFQYALENSQLDKWSGMLSTAASASGAMRQVLDSPSVSVAQIVAIFADVCGDAMDQAGKKLIEQLAQNKRLVTLPMVSALYEQNLAAHRNTADVMIESAYALSDAEKMQLSAALRKKLGKDVRVSTRIDKTLIGGVVIRTGDLVIDGSIRGKLKKLSKQLDS